MWRGCAGTTLTARWWQRIAIRIESLAQPALAADLDARLLIERQLLLVGDSSGSRASTTILNE